MTRLGIIFLSISLLVVASSVSAQTSCLKFPSNSAAPSGYGASWDVFDSAKALLVKSNCPTSGNSLNISIGKGDTTQYVWGTSYTYNGTTWDSITLTGTDGTNGWRIGSGTKTVTAPASVSTQSPFYFVGYVCTNRSNVWKCGCADSACTTSSWQLQGYTGIPSTGGGSGSGGGGTGGGTTGTSSKDLVGFATVQGMGSSGTTGGVGGAEVTVTTYDQFNSKVKDSAPLIIKVTGTIDLQGQMVQVRSNKTILGVGSTAKLINGGIDIKEASNVIVRNITFADSNLDAISIQQKAHHIWIDHNTITNAFDGAIDIKRGSDFITISWNHIHHHQKNILIGHDDGAGADDIGHLRVTLHHNWFDGAAERNPRIRFGEPVHIYNNYFYRNSVYGVASVMNAGAVIEGNYFDNMQNTVLINYAGSTGRAVVRDNTLVSSEAPESGGTVVEPRTYYNYTMDPSANIPTIVKNGAGVGKI